MSKFHLLIVKFTSPTVRRDPPPHLQAMLRPAYLSKKLTSPIPAKDGGTLRTVLSARAYQDAPDFVEVGEAGVAVSDTMRHQRRVQLVG